MLYKKFHLKKKLKKLDGLIDSITSIFPPSSAISVNIGMTGIVYFYIRYNTLVIKFRVSLSDYKSVSGFYVYTANLSPISGEVLTKRVNISSQPDRLEELIPVIIKLVNIPYYA